MADIQQEIIKQFDPIETEIIRILNSILSETKHQGLEWEMGRLTNRIKNDLVCLAHKLDYLVSCSGVDGKATQGEWLYDMVWWKNDGDYMSKIILVLESEWTPTFPLDEDFYKLMVARSDHHVWIFEAKTEALVCEAISTCIDNLSNLKGLPPGDRFLFAGVSWNPREFFFDLYVYP